MSEPTPRPWRNSHGSIIDAEGNLVAECGEPGYEGAPMEAKQNAALIVKAVNSHDELVAALKVCELALSNDRNAEGQLGVLGRGLHTKVMRALKAAGVDV